ncbi:hypothetical protein [Stenotrophomonas maltophilia]|uniref:hypothetical protein n=1 Tax=Stenotrophomonas maltophilia TaxID=40324 RepID=UPI000D684674|nr:hypothetical protein [Stenotrophomonas maltophilia]EKT4074390.1 hypothetical protein [Stenotrophomonas maltophilia]EKT4083923.1 hypothetical protein [Stenotrophomonas maltophilia]MBA0288437.1 hypothetical protein [Stenotrophomonas maltophilia]MBA0369428.1 hypothetical protein [Stenotrophomonas maltophilia]MBA0373742.1 hypothetical protein [Stenotrophomonas maltophilia]
MAIALIALLLLETVLLMAWVAGYFSWGIILFNERIAASPTMQARLSLGSLERDLPQDRWLQLAFHALPDGSMAFRESLAPSFGLRYFPVMRGRIVLNARRHEVRVIGLCSWFVAILSLLLLPLVAMRPMVAPMLLVLPLLLASYLVQKRRYAAIVETLRMQLKAEFSR